jgi:hypothetical protein
MGAGEEDPTAMQNVVVGHETASRLEIRPDWIGGTSSFHAVVAPWPTLQSNRVSRTRLHRVPPRSAST